MDSINQHLSEIRSVITEEINALASLPREAILSNGKRIAVRGDACVYRFEIPENYHFVPSTTVRCTIGTAVRFSFVAIVADVQSQFLFLRFPFNLNEFVSEIECKWNPAESVEQLNKQWSTFSSTEIVNNLFERTFEGNQFPSKKEPIFASTFSSSQQESIKQSLNRKISFIIGERKSGKTGVGALLLLNGIREKKRILYLSSSAESLRNCLKEVAEVNPNAIEDSIAVMSGGLFSGSAVSIDYFPKTPPITDETHIGLTKLLSIIAAESEYAEVQILHDKLTEKQRLIEKANEELKYIKDELNRLQNASMIERLRTGKKAVEELQSKIRNKQTLLERLQHDESILNKNHWKKRELLPVPLKDKKIFERFASTQFPQEDIKKIEEIILSKQCFITTFHNIITMPKFVYSSFDIVCIDDAHSLSLPEFFLFASLAKERCFILANVTEQPPQSISQFDAARKWLHKNYFTYYQNEDVDQYRFMVNLLPLSVVSELHPDNSTPTIFTASLTAALENSDIQQGKKGRIFLINTEDQHAVSPQYVGKKKILPFNEVSAKRVVDCIKHALLSGTITLTDILIVTPPSGQPLFLREHLKAHQFGEVEIASLGSIRLCSKRAVIFDLTVAGIDFTLRSLDDKKVGLVQIADMFNTLFSTVTDDLYIVADVAHFKNKYKGRFVSALLEKIVPIRENEAAIVSAVRRFDDLPHGLRQKVIFSSEREKKQSEYTLALEQSKQSTLDSSKNAPVNSIAATDKKLKAEIRLAALRVLAHRDMINLITQYLGALPLYKTTVETQKYSSILPEHDCQNENDFKIVMDMWNLLIYETSDVRKIEHPLFQKARVDSKLPIDLQQIHSFYHSDLEMVVEEGKHRLAQSIQKIFNDCIGKKPVTPVDWMNAYIVFLNRMEKYLDNIINQIRA
ncbi:MAG TPA: hypothetical protein DCQ28_12750 [Bacteroidetes bacterium]|nr:hypothetical protein [Bacteroidota bacterium]